MLVIQANRPVVFELCDTQGATIGRLHVTRRSGREVVRVAFDFPREIRIWRGDSAEDISRQRAKRAKGKPR